MKKIKLLIMTWLLMGLMTLSAAYGVEASTAQVQVREHIDLASGLVKLEYAVTEGTDLYGFSLDMLYDTASLELTDPAGNPLPNVQPGARGIMNPVYGSPDVFGEGGYTSMNIAGIDSMTGMGGISYAIHRIGAVSGKTVTERTVAATVYFKIKQGASFDGFNIQQLEADVMDVNSPSAPCVKLADSYANKVLINLTTPYLAYDLNHDDRIDVGDLQMFSSSYGLSGASLAADINKDGIVDLKDLYAITKNME